MRRIAVASDEILSSSFLAAVPPAAGRRWGVGSAAGTTRMPCGTLEQRNEALAR